MRFYCNMLSTEGDLILRKAIFSGKGYKSERLEKWIKHVNKVHRGMK